jgi:hypothetical protein
MSNITTTMPRVLLPSSSLANEELGELSDFLFDLQLKLTDQEYIHGSKLINSIYKKCEVCNIERNNMEKKIGDIKIKCKTLEQKLLKHKKMIQEYIRVGKKSSLISTSVLRNLLTDCDNMIASFTAQISIVSFFSA